jgi:MFS family permease
MTTTRLEQSVNGADPRGSVGSPRHRRSFWVVAFAFLAVMALGTVPSPLYGLYQARDHFSLFMITVAFAVYAVGVIAALLLAGHLSDLYGRRRLLLPAVGISVVSAIVFLASKSLAGLLVARLINGISIGIVASTATAYLAELHARGRPRATARKAQLTASAVNIGGLAVGALVAGLLAQWVAHPLTVPYFVFLAALVLGAIGVALAPETREAAKPAPRYRPQRLSIPPAERGRYFAAALSTFVAFAANGLFAGLAGLFLAVTLHHPSLALAGGVVCAMFGAGVAAQFLTVTWSITRDLQAGMAVMVIGVGLAVLGVWLHSPSLALFIAGGALIGAGSGAIFKGAVGTVMSISPPERIAESLTGVFLAAYVGISLPVVGAGITLARHVTPKVTILGFATAVTVGIAASAIKLLGRTTTPAPVGPTAAAPVEDARDGAPSRDSIPRITPSNTELPTKGDRRVR